MTTLKQILERQEKEFELYGKLGVIECTPAWMNDLKSHILQDKLELLEAVVGIIELPKHDHSKCPIKETCIGYQNAESDLDNIRDTLLSQINELKK